MMALLMLISVPKGGWREVAQYLYGHPMVEWDVVKDAPRIHEDEKTGLAVFTVAYWDEEGSLARSTVQRLSSGLIGARMVE